MAAEPRIDGFLGGRRRIAQPAGGYRAGADAVIHDYADVPGALA